MRFPRLMKPPIWWVVCLLVLYSTGSNLWFETTTTNTAVAVAFAPIDPSPRHHDQHHHQHFWPHRRWNRDYNSHPVKGIRLRPSEPPNTKKRRITAAILSATRRSSMLSLSATPIENEGSKSPGDENNTSARRYDHEHVWIWECGNEDDANNRGDETEKIGNGYGGTWRKPQQQEEEMVAAAKANAVRSTVRNWCENFVLSLDLCPWAKASVQTRGAMRFFLVPPTTTKRNVDIEMNLIIESVAERFQEEILTLSDSAREQKNDKDGSSSFSSSSSQETSAMERAAIYFVVFLSNNKDNNDDDDDDDDDGEETPSSFHPSADSLADSFFDFIDWFTELEEDWPEEFDDVIIAPFHPLWEFGSGGDFDDDVEACLDYEKRSPYPLVTLVSTDVVDKAGSAVTESIGEHNRKVLLGIEEQNGDHHHHHHHHHNDGNTDGNSSSSSPKSHRNKSVAELWQTAVYGHSGHNRA